MFVVYPVLTHRVRVHAAEHCSRSVPAEHAARSSEMQSGSSVRPIRPYQSVAFFLSRAATCVEINQCVGWRGTGIATPSSRHRVDGVEVER